MARKKNIKETDLFKIFQKLFAKQANGTVRPSDHDDCTVIPLYLGDDALVATVDAIRGPEFSMFREGIINHYDLGHYTVSANLSDIAAMGAYPIGFLNSFRWGPESKLKEIEDYFRGIKNALKGHSLQLGGGDSGSYSVEHMTGVALGRGNKNHLLHRKGAEPGDLVCVTGHVGTMNAALIYFTKDKQMQPTLLKRDRLEPASSWKRPPARIKEGLCLSGNHPDATKVKSKLATACMDTSDGIRTAIFQLSKASGVGFDIWGDHLPKDLSVIEITRLLKRNSFEIQLGIAPDFELLFTIGKDDFDECVERFRREGLNSPSIIGKVNDGRLNRFFPNQGAPAFAEFPGENWNHQGVDSYLSSFSF